MLQTGDWTASGSVGFQVAYSFVIRPSLPSKVSVRRAELLGGGVAGTVGGTVGGRGGFGRQAALTTPAPRAAATQHVRQTEASRAIFCLARISSTFAALDTALHPPFW